VSQRPRVPREAEVEETVDPDHVRPDGRVHEAAEERDAADAQDAVCGIGPRPHVGLEELHDRAGEVEEHDDPQLAPRLEAEHEHPDLDEDRGDREHVVARERCVVGVPEPRRDDRDQQQRSEHAGPGLFEHEHGELDEPRADAAIGGVAEDAVSDRVDALLEGRRSLHAVKRIRAPRQFAVRSESAAVRVRDSAARSRSRARSAGRPSRRTSCSPPADWACPSRGSRSSR